MKTNDVIGLGNTLMDFLIEVDQDLLLKLNLKKGEMHLVEEHQAKELLNKLQNLIIEEIPGGSAANTLKGIGFLGGKAILCGNVGNDEHGLSYIEAIKKYGVSPRINTHHLTTGHSLTLITPDAERTFSVHLGAALTLTKEDIHEEDIKNSKILHLEGYQFEGPTKQTLMYAIELARKHNTLISVDLADPALIRRNKEFFKRLVRDYVDIIFLNEKEALEFTGLEEEEALKEVCKDVKIAVVKIGEKGSLIYSDGKVSKVAGVQAKAVDTTGAGDTFAAGFLYGYCNGWDTKKAGDLGSLFAAKIVEERGVGMREIDVKEIKQKIAGEKMANQRTTKIGIIGGSGLDNPNILTEAQDLEVDTPFGKPTSSLKTGKISGIDVILLARHGREHTIPPTQVNFRANIHALKEAGCTHIIATTACGSLREEIGRGDFVILNQFIDFTRLRPLTFFEEFSPNDMKHTPMAEPFNLELRNLLIKTCEELGLRHHKKGTVVTIEGPRFSTKAESHMFRAWGADVINMSIAPEAILANEIGIPYAAIAMSTDYDCWKEDEEPVTFEEVLKIFGQNVEKVTNLLTHTIPKLKPGIDLKSTIRTIPNWPKPGVMFRDITTLLQNPQAFDHCIQKFKEQYQDKRIDKIVGIESRGFIFGAALARELNLPFVLMRKPGKLPAETVAQDYELEYGTDKVEIHRDAINFGDRVLIVDDLLATGGTMQAACQLVEKLNGEVAGIAFVIDLPDLKGRERLPGYDIFHLVEFEGE